MSTATLGTPTVVEPTFEFVGVWPILLPGPPQAKSPVVLADLFEEAKANLPALARRHRALLLGRPRFSVRPAADVPGSGGTGYVVVATAPARREPRPVL